MKSKLIFGLGSLLLPLAATAVPATPQPISVTNPDGTISTIRLQGDEYFSYATDMEGKRIMQCSANGYWQPATLNGKILTTSASDLALYKESKPNFRYESLKEKRAPQRMATLESTGQTTYNTIGDTRSAVILVEFDDVKFSTTSNPQSTYNDLCNKPGYDEYGSIGSCADYFHDVSGGKFKPQFDVYGPVKLKNTQKYYSTGLSDGSSRDRIFEIIYEAVTALDADVDFSQYDLDGNGTIDNIFFYYAGRGAADTGRLDLYIWPHQGNYIDYVTYAGATPLTVDGVKMATYACSNEIKGDDPSGQGIDWRDGIGTFCHEYSHVLGLPDMYDTENTNQGGTVSIKTPGKYDVMDRGPYNTNSTCPPGYSAYERWLCKWMDYTDIQDNPGSYTVKALPMGDQNPEACRIRARFSDTKWLSEYFVIESRKKEGWDSSLPEEGILMWRIDFNRNDWMNNRPNVGTVPKIDLIQYTCDRFGNYQFAWGKDNATFNIPTSEYPLKLTNRTSYPFTAWITSMDYDSETGDGSFNYNTITELPTVATTMHQPVNDEDSHTVYLSWDPVPGARDYLLTVTNTDVNGTVRYTDNCNARSTEGATKWTIYGLSSSVWKRDAEAYVKVITEIPSSEISNIVKFIPSELADVEGIGNDNPSIHGGYGEVIAPLNTMVYNIGGTQVGKTNLPAGVYLVVCNGKTHKVMVK